MNIVFILMAALIISCGKNPNQNELSRRSDLKIFESQSFASFEHPSESSVLRRKLLNQIVEQKIKKTESFEYYSSESNEELMNDDLGKNLSVANLEEYNQRINFQQKVVLLSNNLTEVFFLPKGIPLKESLSHLKFSQPLTHELITFNEVPTTQKNHVIYLVHFSSEELIENDKFFNKTIQQYNIQENTIAINVEPSQRVQVISQSKFFIQDYQVSRVNGKSAKCTRDTMEAGMCNKCTFEREVLLNQFSQYQQLSISHLNVTHTGHEKSKLKRKTLDQWSVDEIDFDGSENAIVSLTNQKVEPLVVESRPRQYEGLCQSLSQVESLLRQVQVHSDVQVIVWGRGSQLRSLL